MKSKRIAPLFAGELIYLVVGLIYAWSIFVGPIEAEFGWTRTQTSATFTISMICFVVGQFVGGNLIKKKSPGFIIRISAVLLLLGFCLASRVDSIIELYIAYGVFCGFGVGLSYIATIGTVIKWYPDKIGFVSGLLLMGFGLGALILGSIASVLIISIGWRTTFIVFGVVFAILITICSIWIILPGKGIVLPEPKIKDSREMEEKNVFTLPEMIRRPSFWLYFVWATIMASSGLAIIGHAAVGAKDMGAAVGMATFFTGIVSVSNGAGRILAGTVYDNFGRKICMRMNSIFSIVGILILILSYNIGSLPVYFAGGIMMGLSFGTVPPTNSAYINQFYGEKNFAVNFSAINIHVIPAALIGPLVAGMIRTTTGSYYTLFIILLCFSIIGFASQSFIKKA